MSETQFIWIAYFIAAYVVAVLITFVSHWVLEEDLDDSMFLAGLVGIGWPIFGAMGIFILIVGGPVWIVTRLLERRKDESPNPWR